MTADNKFHFLYNNNTAHSSKRNSKHVKHDPQTLMIKNKNFLKLS